MRRLFVDAPEDSSVSYNDVWEDKKDKGPILWKVITSLVILVPVIAVLVFPEHILGENMNAKNRDQGFNCTEREKTWAKCSEEEKAAEERQNNRDMSSL